MKIDYLCKSRQINDIDVFTPLLVPSFSSTIFGLRNQGSENEINILYKFLKEKLKTSTLISLYDLFNEYILLDDVWGSRIIFFDSGYYEYFVYKNAGRDVDWTYDSYYKTIPNLNGREHHILVNYDLCDNLEDQIHKSIELFENFPSFKSDFIVKPNIEGSLINIEEVIDKMDELYHFNIIGFSEKELGKSQLEICKNLIQIRSRFKEGGIDVPIHIYGCLNIINVITLFLCGADIFDGLSWLRYSYLNNYSINISNYSIIKNLHNYDDIDVHNLSCINNLFVIDEMIKNMKEFLKNYDFNVLGVDSQVLKNIEILLNDAGLGLEG